MDKEELRDKYMTPSKSIIDLDSPNTSRNLGFSGYTVSDLYADFILVEYIDINDGQIEDENGLVIKETINSPWRKAIVRAISSVIKDRCKTKIGDIVTFQNDHGLQAGSIDYVDEKGNVRHGKNCVFVNEYRIFSKLTKQNVKQRTR